MDEYGMNMQAGAVEVMRTQGKMEPGRLAELKP
jgi:hypothetical protein